MYLIWICIGWIRVYRIKYEMIKETINNLERATVIVLAKVTVMSQQQ